MSIKRINKLKPYAFYIVDTLGKMYKNDLLRMFYIVDHNLDQRVSSFFLAKSNMMFLQIRHCIFQHFRLRKHGLVGFFVIGSLVQYLLDILLCGRLIRFRGICLRGRL